VRVFNSDGFRASRQSPMARRGGGGCVRSSWWDSDVSAANCSPVAIVSRVVNVLVMSLLLGVGGCSC
jgi:hypothetical protein